MTPDDLQQEFERIRDCCFSQEASMTKGWRVVLKNMAIANPGLCNQETRMIEVATHIKCRVDLQATLIHELAHVVAGPHDDKTTAWADRMKVAAECVRAAGEKELAAVIEEDIDNVFTDEVIYEKLREMARAPHLDFEDAIDMIVRTTGSDAALIMSRCPQAGREFRRAKAKSRRKKH